MKAMPELVPITAGPAAGLRVGLVVGRSDALGEPRCGVRDYARTLAGALQAAGVEAHVMAPESWRPRDAARFRRALRAARFDLVHLQYPSLGHRRSLLPHLLGVAGAAPHAVVTLHEHSALPRVQRAANRLFPAVVDRIVFTTAYEARAFGAKPGTPVITIGSNVPVHPGTPARDGTVLYFGQIRPGKGLEAFLALARLAAETGESWRFTVIGSTPWRWRDYAAGIRAQSASVDWADDLPFAAVAEAMATATAAYLPFPDGASLRRGSLIAALANGLPVIAPAGPGTTAALRAVLLEAGSPAAALACLRQLRADPAVGRTYGAAGRVLAQEFGWPAIAARHVALYCGLLSGA